MKITVKYLKLIFLIVIAVITTRVIVSCEPDDICSESTPTTPKLIVEVRDINNRDNKKDISNLRVQGVGKSDPLSVTVKGNTIVYDGTSNENVLYLPLDTNSDTTQYVLTKDYGLDGSNADTLTVIYIRKTIFVSRACGYKTIFKQARLTAESDGGQYQWIKDTDTVIDNQSIDDETATHFYIYY